MTHSETLKFKSQKSLDRVFSKLNDYVSLRKSDEKSNERKKTFDSRLKENWDELFRTLYDLYGQNYDFFYHLEQIVISCCESYLQRPEEMCQLDEQRELRPLWYREQSIIGGTLYVDLFNNTLRGVENKIGYLKQLGINYLHLMPLFKSPVTDNDGGYAVSDYRSVDTRLGTIEDLRRLSKKLHREGISLVLDFVFNHTSDEHEWAKQAQSGDQEFLDYYYTFESREMPNRYDTTTREIFPTIRRGNFSWHNGMRKWVWTTFNSYQWDLRYANPQVFCSMMQEMLYLSNLGVDILRLDAVAFIWKKEGTTCENLEEALTLLKAFNLVARIAAPSLLFKSEAIVHPDEVRKYIGKDKCQLSYNPLLMATLWESIATRDTSLIKRSIQKHHSLPENCTWVNYIRCHDDIGWTFDDNDAWQIGTDPQGHRSFLNSFYVGEFEGSFSKGLEFQFNPENNDRRVCGSFASLCGLEQAIEQQNELYAEMALARMLVMNNIILTLGGIPLIYLGDEWAILNDYTYKNDPEKKHDSRWVHRPKINWDQTPPNHFFKSMVKRYNQSLKDMIEHRKNEPAFAGVEMEMIETNESRSLCYARQHSGSQLLIINNLSDSDISLDTEVFQTQGSSSRFIDLITGDQIELRSHSTIDLKPYQFIWLRRSF